MSVPRTPLRASRLRTLLQASLFGRHILVLGCVDSTSDRLIDLARKGAVSGTVLAADAQSAGRGRRGTHWVSPRGGGLYASFLVRELPPADDLRLLSSALGMALVETLTARGIQASLKWPNDVLHDGAKLAGALVDVTSSREGTFAVAGFGLNLTAPDLGHRDSALQATGLASIAAGPWLREELLASVLIRYEAHHLKLLAGERETLRANCLAHDALKNRRVRARLAQELVEGVVLAADPVLGLLLATADGSTRRLDAARTHLEWIEPLNAAARP